MRLTSKQILVSSLALLPLALNVVARYPMYYPAENAPYSDATEARQENTLKDENKDSSDANKSNSNNNRSSTNKATFNAGRTTNDFSTQANRTAETSSEYYSPVKSIYVKEKLIGNTVVTDNNVSYPSRTYEIQALPNDPAANQWWVQSANLPALWDSNTGSSETLLAIIDTGFALEHEEFQGRWHENVGETGITLAQAPSRYNCSDQSLPLDRSCNLIDDNYDGIVDNETGTTVDENSSQLNCSDRSIALDKSCNMIDDDGNGLVDDWRGWDFMNFDRSVQAGDVDPNGKGTKHGTYVTAVAAGNADNGVGIAGVNWNTRVLPIQALGDGGSGASIGVARSIRYAVAQGADVISMSLGGAFPDSFTRQAIQEAIAEGVIIVSASGNDGCDCISYPANYPEVLSVGALDQSDERAYFSSYGENLDILAPGTNLYTATWSPSNQTSAYASGIAGTSLATPIVSGLVTSLVGQYPELTPREIISVLTENTNRLSIPADHPHSETLGYGTLDANSANLRPNTSIAPALRYTFTPVSFGDALFPDSDIEPIGNSQLYTCSDSQFGSTKIYRLYNGSSEFYTASETEVYYANTYGYTARLLMHACIGLDIDSPEAIRMINVFSEFGRINKLYL